MTPRRSEGIRVSPGRLHGCIGHEGAEGARTGRASIAVDGGELDSLMPMRWHEASSCSGRVVELVSRGLDAHPSGVGGVIEAGVGGVIDAMNPGGGISDGVIIGRSAVSGDLCGSRNNEAGHRRKGVHYAPRMLYDRCRLTHSWTQTGCLDSTPRDILLERSCDPRCPGNVSRDPRLSRGIKCFSILPSSPSTSVDRQQQQHPSQPDVLCDLDSSGPLWRDFATNNEVRIVIPSAPPSSPGCESTTGYSGGGPAACEPQDGLYPVVKLPPSYSSICIDSNTRTITETG